MSQWPFGNLPVFGFDFVMADPPWPWRAYSDKGLELFSRQSRPGWTTWGNEATKFDEATA